MNMSTYTYEDVLNDVINDKIRITEFMDAIGKKPVDNTGTLLTYTAPYNIEELVMGYGIRTQGKPTCLVDTKRNCWRDKNYTPWQPLKMLVLEMTGIYHEGRLNHTIAHEIFDYRQKNGVRQEEPTKLSNTQTVDRLKQKPEVPSKPSKPKRKLKF